MRDLCSSLTKMVVDPIRSRVTLQPEIRSVLASQRTAPHYSSTGRPSPAPRLSQRPWFRPCLNRRQRFATDLGLKTTQPLIDRNQLDDRAPRVDKILKRGSDLRERIQNLVHRTERDLAGNDRWSEQDVRKNDVGLQINDAADIEVHEVQVEPEVVPANGTEQLVHGRWIGAGGIILAKHELLAIGRFDPLVEKLDPGQPDADQRQRPWYRAMSLLKRLAGMRSRTAKALSETKLRVSLQDNFASTINVICPVQSPFAKNDSLLAAPKSPLQLPRLVPHDRRIAIVTDAWTGLRTG